MKPIVYVETTIVSYLTAWPSRDVVVHSHQLTTREWWETAGDRFELVASSLVIDEASRGDKQAAEARLAVLAKVPLLESNDHSVALTRALVKSSALPEKAFADAAHIAIAVSGGADYLVTWNCRHIANAAARSSIDRICLEVGFEPIIICTPEELVDPNDGTRKR